MEMKINESEGSNSKAFIMINCGGSKDLTKYWFAEKDNMACILLDSHRPIHHNNVHYKKNIIVIDDGHCNFQNCPTDEGSL
jgi:cell division control protein 45